jgi:hypothetical protein
MHVDTVAKVQHHVAANLRWPRAPRQTGDPDLARWLQCTVVELFIDTHPSLHGVLERELQARVGSRESRRQVADIAKVFRDQLILKGTPADACRPRTPGACRAWRLPSHG